MANRSIKIQLTPEERHLILRHGYPFERLRQALHAAAQSEKIKTITMQPSDLEMLIGQLSRSFNHDQAGTDEDALLDLCDRLEYAERTGDGTLDIL